MVFVLNMTIATSKMGYVGHTWDFEPLVMENLCCVVVAIYCLAVGRQPVFEVHKELYNKSTGLIAVKCGY
jgi:hypothetical protein